MVLRTRTKVMFHKISMQDRQVCKPRKDLSGKGHRDTVRLPRQDCQTSQSYQDRCAETAFVIDHRGATVRRPHTYTGVPLLDCWTATHGVELGFWSQGVSFCKCHPRCRSRPCPTCSDIAAQHAVRMSDCAAGRLRCCVHSCRCRGPLAAP